MKVDGSQQVADSSDGLASDHDDLTRVLERDCWLAIAGAVSTSALQRELLHMPDERVARWSENRARKSVAKMDSR